MTKGDARAALRAFVGVGDIEPWIAGRPWQAVPGGWTVAGELQGWRFRVEVMPGVVRAGVNKAVVQDGHERRIRTAAK